MIKEEIMTISLEQCVEKHRDVLRAGLEKGEVDVIRQRGRQFGVNSTMITVNRLCLAFVHGDIMRGDLISCIRKLP